ncbi:MAG: hypothetical protein AAB268_04995 [Elusimicrobiota bacterium]
MNKNLFPLIAVIILAAHARAVVVAPSGANAHTWVSPVAEAFASIGADHIAAFGMPSLTALSTLDSSARYPFIAAPQVLELLAKHLPSYATPEGFAGMPNDDKLIFLRAAAKDAQTEAATIANEVLTAVESKPLHPGTMNLASKKAAEAEAVSLYLDAGLRNKVRQMSAKVANFQLEWHKHVEKFYKELPLAIAHVPFDILVKTEHGWIAADESPYPIEADPSQFYERRIAVLRKAPEGPWRKEEAALLSGALDLLIPTDDQYPEWARKAKGQLSEFKNDNIHLRKDLLPAITAFKKNALNASPVAPRHILAVENHYKNVLNNSGSTSPHRLRIQAAIRNGTDGLPSWNKFQEIERSTIRRTSLGALYAALVTVVSTILMGGLLRVVGLPAWPLAAKLAMLVACLSPLIVYVRKQLLVDKLESARDFFGIARELRRIFPND